MITLLEGTPGSGKSYYAVADYLLPWLRAGRRLYVAVDGFYLDRLALFEGRPLPEIQKQVTLWTERTAIPSLLLSIEPGSAVCLDEAQTIFRAKEKVPGEILRWLETHRHYGVDLLLMAQDYRQLTSGVTRLVESTIKFRRMERFGMRRRFQGFVRGNPEETEVIRTLIGRYEPKIYAYYSSYATGGITEERRMKTILSSPLLLVGLVGLIGALGFIGWGTWFSGTKPSAAQLPPPPNNGKPVFVPPAENQSAIDSIAPPSATSPSLVTQERLRIEGGIVMNGKAYWVDAQGRILTAGQITALVGAPVTEQIVNGVPSLVSDRIVWGGEGSPPVLPQLLARQPLDEVAAESSPLLNEQENKPDVKCIGVDNQERACDGSSRD
ncbi:MAG: zonular occludens toxin domain-containing protein [Nitrospira sp.]|nr:zonular occludens toxin domain-containing protein [Nitrospira sp.]MDH4242696.1 zonular occludens toxin domain-containing protein [Nitrospira sp.]MDH4355035.1 zonular occludens toxin domain-containing protein [Nitrospira sp.]MDH5316979.1 zonular occludens toxin domain-containing protein [Nitrospira sp.]MDH5520454.1 zonular occludens toxin domain-containing protein [Acidimicrobiia bacterium]